MNYFVLIENGFIYLYLVFNSNVNYWLLFFFKNFLISRNEMFGCKYRFM